MARNKKRQRLALPGRSTHREGASSSQPNPGPPSNEFPVECHSCGGHFFTQRALTVHLTLSDVCSSSLHVPPNAGLSQGAAPWLSASLSAPDVLNPPNEHPMHSDHDNEASQAPRNYDSDDSRISFSGGDRGPTYSDDDNRLSPSHNQEHNYFNELDESSSIEDDDGESLTSLPSDYSESELSIESGELELDTANFAELGMDFPSCIADYVHLRYAELVHKYGMPLKAFRDMQLVAADAQAMGHEFKHDEVPHYDTYIRSLKRQLKLDNLDHKLESVVLPWGGTAHFPVFDFEAMFLQLIDDPRLRDHLLINYDDLSASPPYDPEVLDDIHSGDWHIRTHRLTIQAGSNQVMAALHLFLDRTHLVNHDRQGCECLLFTISLLPRSIRNKWFSWRPLGMVPKFHGSHKKGQKAVAYHLIMDKILASLCRVQAGGESGGIVTTILNPKSPNNSEIKVHFKCPVCGLLGDVEGHDKACGRVQSHRIATLCRECNCLKKDADNVDKDCIMTKASAIKALIEAGDETSLKKLDDMGYYHLQRNAFHHLWYGDNPRGVNGCCQPEVLHAVNKGVMEYAIKEFFGRVVVKDNEPGKVFNILVKEVSLLLQKQSDREYPRTKAPGQIHTLSHCEGHHVPGVILVVVVTLFSQNCWMSDDSNSIGRSRSVNRVEVVAFRHMFELLLLYESWYRVGPVMCADVEDGTVKRAVKEFLRTYIKTLNRQEGEGTCLTKVHTQLHQPHYLLENASNQNFNGGPCESNHKEILKKTAKNTQRRFDSLDDQIAKRLTQKLTIGLAQGLVDPNQYRCQSEDVDNTTGRLKGTPFSVDVYAEEENFAGDLVYHRHLRWTSRHKKDHPTLMPPKEALDFLVQIVETAMLSSSLSRLPEVSFSCFTEYKVGDQIYRAHPNYRKDGSWYDWAYFKYEYDSEDPSQIIPGQIWFFVDLSEPIMVNCTGDSFEDDNSFDLRTFFPNWVDNGADDDDGCFYAVITSMRDVPSPLNVLPRKMNGQSLSVSDQRELSRGGTSLILKTGMRHNELYFISTEAIRGPAMVIDNPGRSPRLTNSLIVVTPRSQWPAMFLQQHG